MHPPPQDWLVLQRNYWNKIAPQYDSLYRSRWSMLEDTHTVTMLSMALSKEQISVLELACGTGLGYRLLKRLGRPFDYMGTDISENMLCEFRKHHPELGEALRCGPMTELEKAFGNDDETFDAIVSIYTSMSFAEKPVEAIEQSYKLIRKGGIVFVSFVNRWSMRRLLAGKIARIEKFQTRGAAENDLAVPAWTVSVSEAKGMLVEAGFRDVRVFGQGFFAGFLEKPSLWPADRLFSRFFPYLCHTLNLQGRK